MLPACAHRMFIRIAAGALTPPASVKLPMNFDWNGFCRRSRRAHALREHALPLASTSRVAMRGNLFRSSEIVETRPIEHRLHVGRGCEASCANRRSLPVLVEVPV